ncbi:hypothetical protein MSG28_003181 [Choristoneura fumiferana]|uniref:Uncharacterized protein n=1 Tax=Choristoneura fumiferana TaxID=7141 RepID=A0ACC0KEB4_CHOFU|nr:hypothetical protein MSG28_003181 [Choristoneura fumiferana]
MEVKKIQPASDEELKSCFPDLPLGPLDGFRRKASFDWRRMKLAYDNINAINTKNKVWSFMNHILCSNTRRPLRL